MASPEAGQVSPVLVRVIEERPVSLALAEEAGVQHQSPQAILLKDRKGVWSDSHRNLTVDAFKKAAAL